MRPDTPERHPDDRASATPDPEELTDRQLREIEYHRGHAAKHAHEFERISYEVIEERKRRWWNAYWTMFTLLLRENLRGKAVLVAGCGFGEDALRLAKLGADVRAFDLSEDVLAVARDCAEREGLRIEFRTMPIETLDYPEATFDAVVARDILHHADFSRALPEILRVSKPGALLIVNEIYTHSWLQRVRESRLVRRVVYPRMVRFVYKGRDPYITEDEAKLTEREIREIREYLDAPSERYFYAVINRVLPDTFGAAARIDRAGLALVGPAGGLLGGRVLLCGRLRNRR